MSQNSTIGGDGGRRVGDDVVLAQAGVRVLRRIEADEYEVPVVEYVLKNERDVLVGVRLVQPLPSDFSVAQVGLHRDHGRDHWQAPDNSTIVYRRLLSPGATATTVCGLQVDDEVPALEEPTLQVTVPRAGESSTSRDAETIELDDPTAESSAPGSSFDDDLAANLADLEGKPNRASGSGEGIGSAGDDLSSSAVDGFTPPDVDGVVGAFLEELRSGSLSEAEQRALREELNLGVSESTSAFVDHLRDRVNKRHEHLLEEIESIEESVERLFSVKADAGDLDRLKREFDQFDDDTVDVATIERLATVVDELRSRMVTEDDLESIRGQLAELRRTATAIEDVERTLQRVETEIEAIDSSDEVIEELREETVEQDALDKLELWIEGVEDRKADDRDLQDLSALVTEEYVTEVDLRREVDRHVLRSLRSLFLLSVGISGLVAAVPAALVEPTYAMVAVAVAAIGFFGWWLVRRFDPSVQDRFLA